MYLRASGINANETSSLNHKDPFSNSSAHTPQYNFVHSTRNAITPPGNPTTHPLNQLSYFQQTGRASPIPSTYSITPPPQLPLSAISSNSTGSNVMSAARFQQHQAQLMQKLHHASPNSHYGGSGGGQQGQQQGGGPPGGGTPGGPPHHHHTFSYPGPPPSPAGYPGYPGGPHAGGHSGLTPGGGPPPAGPHQNSGQSPFGSHLGQPNGGPPGHHPHHHHHTHQQHNQQSQPPQQQQQQQSQNQPHQQQQYTNGTLAPPPPAPPSASQSNLNLNNSSSAFWQQQRQLANMSRQSTSAHHHARAAHLQQRGMTTSGSMPIGDPNRHPSMSIGTRTAKDGKEINGATPGLLHKRTDSLAVGDGGDHTPAGPTRTSTAVSRAAKGANIDASSPRQLNTAAVIEAEREKTGQAWSTIDMGGMHLRNLSMELFKYSFLTTLYVPHNNLTSLPAALSTLSHLILLDASGNKLSSVPGELGMLTNLRELLLFDNQLTSLPPELGTLHQLDVIGIEGNPLPDNLRQLMEKEGTTGLVAFLRDSCPVPLPPPEREWITVEADSFPTVADAGVPEPETFSALCYNVLCHTYATPTMYGYTPSWALSWDYRKELILQEILGYGADVLCLQEVAVEQYEEFFLRHLTEHGYEGVYYPRTRARTMTSDEKKHVDGCATFFKASTFQLVEQQPVEFSQLAMRRTDFKKTEDIYNRVMTKDHIAVLALLEHKQSGARLIISNVHIYWDPEFRDVKLVQVAMMMEEIEKTANHFARLPPKLSLGKGYERAPTYSDGSKIPLIICGDFNSVPKSGVYEYLSQGELSAKHEDFMDHVYGTYTTDGIFHKFPLKSSYSHYSDAIHPEHGYKGELPFTNHVPGFKGPIDYIWYTNNSLTVTGLLGEVDANYLKKVVGFPNAHFPSDHVPILAEFKIKQQKKQIESGANGDEKKDRGFNRMFNPQR